MQVSPSVSGVGKVQPDGWSACGKLHFLGAPARVALAGICGDPGSSNAVTEQGWQGAWLGRELLQGWNLAAVTAWSGGGSEL